MPMTPLGCVFVYRECLRYTLHDDGDNDDDDEDDCSDGCDASE